LKISLFIKKGIVISQVIKKKKTEEEKEENENLTKQLQIQ